MTALIFDCDGTLADTERYGHLPAFNQVFREFGLPVQWDDDEYRRRLAIAGGKERLASLLTPDFIRAAHLPTGREAQSAEVARWHRRKTEIYVEMVAQGRVRAQAGVRRIIAEALDAGWTLAVASTAAESSVRAILDYAAGPDRAAQFALVLAGDCVPRKKPAPDVYRLALERLAVSPSVCLAVEDSRSGLMAATAAGLHCLVVVNEYTHQEDYREATLVVTSLGDPAGEHTRVIANRGRARPGAYLTLRDLKDCVES